jgi:hypothetical protein
MFLEHFQKMMTDTTKGHLQQITDSHKQADTCNKPLLSYIMYIFTTLLGVPCSNDFVHKVVFRTISLSSEITELKALIFSEPHSGGCENS